VLLTADHGNVEEMRFADGGINTQHSTNPVPVVFVSRDPQRWTIRDGELSDVGPTLLGLLGIPVPDRMTGHSLLAER
jgi:2,3-bisphosphoglycerate-independent phosphoglycerate mutase